MNSCRQIARLAACLLSFLPPAIQAAEAAPDRESIDFFERSIRPILASHCHECHGSKKQEAGLRLDTRDAVMAGGDSGPAIIPGEPEKSRLVTAIHYGNDLQMPPDGKLEKEQIAALSNWVKLGRRLGPRANKSFVRRRPIATSRLPTRTARSGHSARWPTRRCRQLKKNNGPVPQSTALS